MENYSTEESIFINRNEQVRNRNFAKTPRDQIKDEINRARNLERRLKSKIVKIYNLEKKTNDCD